MQFLLTTVLLFSSLSAFALPEDYYYDAPYINEEVEVEVVTVKVVDTVEATTENAYKICQDLGYTRASSYTASATTESDASELLSVECNK